MAFFTGGIYGARVAANFTKSADVTLAGITGLLVNLESGKTYGIEAWVPATLDAVGGGQWQVGGTFTNTNSVYDVRIYNAATGAISAANRGTSVGGTLINITGVASASYIVSATITVNAGGTFTINFAQQAASGASSVLRGARLLVVEMS
jgi:hypothetical protein